MKTTCCALLMALAAITSSLKVNATNYNNYGSFAAYNLNNGDTLRILQGNFTGVITNLPAGAVIIVSSGAGFNPTTLNLFAPAGKIINNGNSTLGSLGIGGGFFVENNATVTVSGDMNFYNGILKTFRNNAGAQLTVNGSLSMSDNTMLINEGIVTVTNAMNLYTSTAQLTNRGKIVVGGSLSSNGQLVNENRINMGGDLNYYGGSLNNSGSLNPAGTFSVSSGAVYTNNCRLITKGGINNYGTLVNNGLIWAGTTNTPADQFTNSGAFVSAANAKLRSVNFTNYNSITGTGYFYASGTTTLGGSATVGVNGITADSIKIYDLTRTNTTGIFDNQWGSVRPNVKYAILPAPDSIELYAGCSNVFRSSVNPLPVNWNYFYVRLSQGIPELSWSAEWEAGMRFDIQRSRNNRDFETIATVFSTNSASYVFLDKDPIAKGGSSYYRIRASSAVDGEIKYSATRMLKGEDDPVNSVNCYPNPVRSHLSLTYRSSTGGNVLVRVRSSQGQQVLTKTFPILPGSTKMALNEAAALSAGIYFIDIISGDAITATQRFVKE